MSDYLKKVNKDYSYLNNLLIESVGLKIRYLNRVGAKGASKKLLNEQEEKIAALKKANEDLVIDNIAILSDEIDKCKNISSLKEITAWIKGQAQNVTNFVDFCSLRDRAYLMRTNAENVGTKLVREGKAYMDLYDSILERLNLTSEPYISGIYLVDAITCMPFLNADTANNIYENLLLLNKKANKKEKELSSNSNMDK